MEFLTTKAFYPQRIAEKSERFLSSTFRQQVNRPIPQGFTPNLVDNIAYDMEIDEGNYPSIHRSIRGGSSIVLA